MIFIFVDIVHDAYGKGSSDLGALKVAIRILTWNWWMDEYLVKD